MRSTAQHSTYRGLLAQHAGIHHGKLALAKGAAVVKVSALEPSGSGGSRIGSNSSSNGDTCSQCVCMLLLRAATATAAMNTPTSHSCI